tara:strand:- start:1566 stop:2426 length:861 start_codon:yes stop_codon:yes gene_type:complete
MEKGARFQVSKENQNQEKKRIVKKNLEIRKKTSAAAFLSEETGLSKKKIKDAMTKGAVWISLKGKQKRLRRAASILPVGSFVSLFYDQKILELKPKKSEPVFKSSTYSVWIKPRGTQCGGTKYGDHCTINRILEMQLKRPCFLVHRLDRFCTGVLAIAHSKGSAKAISQQFRDRLVIKKYKAIVHGHVEKKMLLESPIDGKAATTNIVPICFGGNRTLVSIHIRTGRKHQIRKHLSKAGFPIIGDRQYGSQSKIDLQLASVFIGFVCPEAKEQVSFELPTPLHPRL